MANVKRNQGKFLAKAAAKNEGSVAHIGIIGGSGLYSMSGLTTRKKFKVKTPFGDPSDAFVTRHPGREARRISRAPRPRPSHPAQ